MRRKAPTEERVAGELVRMAKRGERKAVSRVEAPGAGLEPPKMPRPNHPKCPVIIILTSTPLEHATLHQTHPPNTSRTRAGSDCPRNACTCRNDPASRNHGVHLTAPPHGPIIHLLAFDYVGSRRRDRYGGCIDHTDRQMPAGQPISDSRESQT